MSHPYLSGNPPTPNGSKGNKQEPPLLFWGGSLQKTRRIGKPAPLARFLCIWEIYGEGLFEGTPPFQTFLRGSWVLGTIVEWQ